MNNKTYSLIGARVPKVDDKPKMTGSGIYVYDINIPGMLFGKVLRSPHPHAEIIKIDTSEAWQVPGVRAVITADDTPKRPFSFIQDLADKLPLCDRKVRYVGDEVAGVAAESKESASEAIKKIRVEYKVLPTLDDPIEAMKTGASKIHEDRGNVAFEVHKEFGNLEEAFKKADVIFEDTYTTPKQHHACLEPRGCVARFDPFGKLTLWSPSQAPHTLKQELSRLLEMNQGDIRVIKPLVGGAFGRGLVADMIEPIAAILSKKTKRPVKIVKDRAEDFATSKTRYPFIMKLKTGVSKEGRIIAKQAEVIADNGAYNDKGPAVVNFAGVCYTAQYNVENLKYDAYLVYTNKEYGTAFRGFGNPQLQFAFESQLDDIAHKLGIDPMKIRLLNANRPGKKTVTGAVIDSCGMVECIEEAGAAAKWENRGLGREKGTPKVKGVGMSVVFHTGAGSRYYGYNSSSAFIKVSDEGKISLITPATDMGQGAETVMAQIAAETIGLNIDDIIVRTGDTDLTPYELGAFGSRTTFVCGNAVRVTAEKVREEVLTLASEMLGVTKDHLVSFKDRIWIKESPDILIDAVPFGEVIKYGITKKGRSIAVSGEYFDPIAPTVSLTEGYGIHMPTWVSACYIAEVEVDVETGFVRVANIWAANDSGTIINRNMAEGQVDGGIIQGIGYTLTEEFVIDNGRVATDSYMDYKILGAKDIPRIQCIFIEKEDKEGPFGAKGLGEHPLVAVAPAIGNAIYDAIGIRIKDLPFTPEKILSVLESSVNRSSI